MPPNINVPLAIVTDVAFTLFSIKSLWWIQLFTFISRHSYSLRVPPQRRILFSLVRNSDGKSPRAFGKLGMVHLFGMSSVVSKKLNTFDPADPAFPPTTKAEYSSEMKIYVCKSDIKYVFWKVKTLSYKWINYFILR